MRRMGDCVGGCVHMGARGTRREMEFDKIGQIVYNMNYVDCLGENE
jgi:hypothetical protein